MLHPKRIIVGLLAILLISGCIAAVERIVHNVSMQDAGTAAESDSTLSADGELPSDWPSDAPVYPKATVTFAGAANSMIGDGGIAVVLSSPADIQEVKNYYLSELPDAGWNIKSTMEAQGSVIYLAEKSGRTMSVTITGSDGNVTVSIGLQIKKS